MKKILISAGLTVVLTACSFLSPYQITFTTRESEAFDPLQSTLDLVVNNPALVYVSGYQCGDAPEVMLLPVVTEGMTPQTVWNLSLDFLADQAPGTLCAVNVGAFDTSTTATSSQPISLYMYSTSVSEEVGEAVAEEAAVEPEAEPVEVPVEETLTTDETPA